MKFIDPRVTSFSASKEKRILMSLRGFGDTKLRIGSELV